MKMTDVKAGDVVVADAGFACMAEGHRYEVKANAKGELYVECDHGNHYLEGQKNGAGDIVGLSQVAQ